MPTFTASQHIYANVDATISHTNRGGFQTLCYTHETLTEEDTRSIEKRVFYLPGDEKPKKRIFFTLPGGSIVLGSIIPVAGRDDAGRTGRHLAHCFILSKSIFDAFTFSAIHFLRHAPFITSIEEALTACTPGSDNIPPLEIEIPAELTQPVYKWGHDNLKTFLYHALRAHTRATETQTIAFVGSTPTIEEAIAAASLLLPSPLRSLCTFDTVFQNGGNVRHTYYWAVGLDAPPRQQTYDLIDTSSQTLSDSLAPQTQLTLYEKWVDTSLRTKEISTILADKDVAYALCQYIEGYTSKIPDASDSLVNCIVSLAEDTVTTRLRYHIEGIAPAPLTDRICPVLVNPMSQRQKLMATQTGFTVSALLDTLYSTYLESKFDKPGRSERSQLATLLEKHPHTSLSLLLYCWQKNKNELYATLGTLNDVDYISFVQYAMQFEATSPLFNLLHPIHAGAFCQLFTSRDNLQDGELLQLARSLAKAEAHSGFDVILPYLSQLTKRQLKKLRRNLKEYAPAERLLNEVTQRIEEMDAS